MMKSIAFVVLLCLVFSGCSLFEEQAKAEVIFRMDRSDFFLRNSFTINATDGKNVIRVDEIEDFESETYFTNTQGTLEISIGVRNTEEDILSRGTVKLDLKEDWIWSVRLRADNTDYDPVDGCFGCITYYSFTINKDAIQSSGQIPDSLYVVIGGNSVSEPVDY